jgi:hypothetical protein
MAHPDNSAAAAEQALFAAHGSEAGDPGALFILGAPRTGSTLIYQLMATAFGLPYISNLTNDHFGETPIVGLALQKSVAAAIQLRSEYGKTKGPWQPSEGSAVMGQWFGGGHPSEIVSARILEGREPHMMATLRAVEAIHGKPLLTKNPWNCFRAPYLVKALPAARFIWIKRDIAAAAQSDLEARYATKGAADGWNSATPANVEALRRLPPVEQVVENQYEFSRAIGDALRAAAPGRRLDVWYEDLVADPAAALGRIGAWIGLPLADAPQDALTPEPRVSFLSPGDKAALVTYAGSDESRFAPLRRAD